MSSPLPDKLEALLGFWDLNKIVDLMNLGLDGFQSLLDGLDILSNLWDLFLQGAYGFTESFLCYLPKRFG